ncbi:hypothetical protein NDN01_02565 [Sphingomonas sp. QA11]|uniref:hypothetical protein n=1 Tax=Sphingomonas sp. QA11 TaxID=2950605 RepID=UPI002349FCF9|nr:hypothetical protein [Sphingomonas sp. QA11]WCM27831.1 hypothetical protein NDN01_02565 [Sphingomonas sp. QA11]
MIEHLIMAASFSAASLSTLVSQAPACTVSMDIKVIDGNIYQISSIGGFRNVVLDKTTARIYKKKSLKGPHIIVFPLGLIDSSEGLKYHRLFQAKVASEKPFNGIYFFWDAVNKGGTLTGGVIQFDGFTMKEYCRGIEFRGFGFR